MSKRECRVCKVQKAASEMDGTGRCRSCARVVAATNVGMTYGKYMALRREGQLSSQLRLQNRINRQRYSETYCKNCGGIIPENGKSHGFCCRECEAEWEQKEAHRKNRKRK